MSFLAFKCANLVESVFSNVLINSEREKSSVRLGVRKKVDQALLVLCENLMCYALIVGLIYIAFIEYTIILILKAYIELQEVVWLVRYLNPLHLKENYYQIAITNPI